MELISGASYSSGKEEKGIPIPGGKARVIPSKKKGGDLTEQAIIISSCTRRKEWRDEEQLFEEGGWRKEPPQTPHRKAE